MLLQYSVVRLCRTWLLLGLLALNSGCTRSLREEPVPGFHFLHSIYGSPDPGPVDPNNSVPSDKSTIDAELKFGWPDDHVTNCDCLRRRRRGE